MSQADRELDAGGRLEFYSSCREKQGSQYTVLWTVSLGLQVTEQDYKEQRTTEQQAF